MAKSNIEREIEARTAAFASDLTDLIRRSVLESLAGSLGSAAPSAAAASTKSAGPVARRGKRGGRGGSMAGAGSIAEFVASNPGSRLEQIAVGLGVKSAKLKKTVAAMLAAGQLTKTGQKRGTQYHPGKGGGEMAAAGAAEQSEPKARRRGPASGSKKTKRVTKKKAS